MQLLNCHPKIDCKSELLDRKYLQIHELCGADSRILINYVLASLIPQRIWLPFTGFKLFNEQLESSDIQLKDLLNALYCPRMIILYRESMLETYASLQIAVKTGVWYSKKFVNNERIEVDWQKFVDYITMERTRWQRSMMELSMNNEVLFVSYEELLGDMNKTMSRIFLFLNLGMCHVKGASLKQNPLPLQEKIVNYEQIEQKMLQSEDSFIITKEWLKKNLGTRETEIVK